MTLVSAVLAMVMLSTTTVALLMLSATEPIIANNLLRGFQAFYVAESGLEIALASVNHDILDESMSGTLAGGGRYTVTVTVDGAELAVRSVGQVETATRVVSNRFEQIDGRWQPMRRFREEP